MVIDPLTIFLFCTFDCLILENLKYSYIIFPFPFLPFNPSHVYILKYIDTNCPVHIMLLLVLDNQLGCSFLGDTISLAVSIPELPVVLYLREGPH